MYGNGISVHEGGPRRYVGDMLGHFTARCYTVPAARYTRSTVVRQQRVYPRAALSSNYVPPHPALHLTPSPYAIWDARIVLAVVSLNWSPSVACPQMPATLSRYLVFLLPILILLCFSQSASLTTSRIMDSLPSPFTVSIDGLTIAQVSTNGNQGPLQAELGPNAAIFTLHDSRLRCGDWLLARNVSEDRSMLPKKVLWFEANAENEARIQPVTARRDGDSYQIQFAGISTS